MTASGNHRAPDRPAYVPYGRAPASVYAELGFKCGLEIHQQLTTVKKLFCRCPAGIYQDGDEFDAQLVRHMRPTLSELGEYDGTALMEFRTKKNITYRIKGETACTYDIDDTPPFPLNRDALRIAIEIALLLKTNIVGELHITRKQYLDGSIPTGFQRTGIVGIEGEIPLSEHPVRIIQLSVEEDSCREVSDVGHERVYTTDRLGMPLVETVTYPDMRTPAEAAEAAQYIRYLTRSTGKVNTGIGAARQDVNVSIEGGTRVEIKGVQHIRWLPRLTHNEAFRQSALLSIRDDLVSRVDDSADWSLRQLAVAVGDRLDPREPLRLPEGYGVVALALPAFGDVLARFTSPGRSFADELSDRLKVIACIEKPNMTFAGDDVPALGAEYWERLVAALGAESEDGVVLVWGPEADLQTAVETVDERCRWAFQGVPNETRKAMPDGTTIFERVLPGPDRMYPDTDSAPIGIDEEMIEEARSGLPDTEIHERLAALRAWGVPADAHTFILRNDLFAALREIVEASSLSPRFAGTLVGHVLRNACKGSPLAPDRVTWLVREVDSRGFAPDILKALIPLAVDDVDAPFDDLLARAGYEKHSVEDIVGRIAGLQEECAHLPSTDRRDWIMGQLRPLALGNLPLRRLAEQVEEALR